MASLRGLISRIRFSWKFYINAYIKNIYVYLLEMVYATRKLFAMLIEKSKSRVK